MSFSTITRSHLVLVQLSLWALLANPMHKFVAAKSGAAGMNAILEVALIVPLKQQWVLRCFKRWLFVSANALRATTIILHTLCNLALPLVVACWALSLGPEVTASKRLLRCLGILVMVPVSCLSWCLGSKRVVLTQ